MSRQSPVSSASTHHPLCLGIDTHSRYVLTSSKDWNVIVWDLASDTDPPRRVTTLRFDAPVTSAAFHPRNSQIILVLLGVGEAYLVDLRKDHPARTELADYQDEEADGKARPRNTAFTVAQFDPAGKHVFIGTSTGYVLVFNCRTKLLIARHKINGAGIIKGLEFTKTGRRLVTNSSDRILRQFNLPAYPSPSVSNCETLRLIESELEPTYRFHDPINKTAWHAMSYSPDGDWLAGGAADNATHKIYIWDIQNEGQFASTLDGGREPLIHVHWHPLKPVIASTTNRGNILIWHCPAPERWGAFAGGFEEVDENVEYEEREDEFDIEDESAAVFKKQQIEDEAVDIFTMSEEYDKLPPSLPREEDEDLAWADSNPDDDHPGWKLKVLMEEDEDMR
ncbi:WD40 repeat-like protein [Panus rudis PR-1116 ss-1]|nr:WD40 repeat-like protein [Panus rudis PR-1116 ss-1]